MSTTDIRNESAQRLTRWLERHDAREALEEDARTYARLCVQAVNAGDFVEAGDWASEYEQVRGKADLLLRLNHHETSGGDAA